jgi:phage-related protein (TIGR01555 family)
MGSLLQFPRIRFPFGDSFKNLLAGFGVPGRDKAMSQRFVLNLIDPRQLTDAYRGDWIARKVCDVPPFDACRAWREWQAEQDQVEKIEEAEREFGLQRKLMWAMSKARLFGGAAIVMGIEGQKFEDELDLEAVGEGDLKFVHVVTRYMIEAGPLMRDITSPWFGEPSYYYRSNAPTPQPPASETLEQSSLGYQPGSQLWIHPSRVVRLVGLDYPDWEQGPDQWGDSALQPVCDAIFNTGLVTSAIATMIAEAKLDIIKLPGLMELLSTAEGSKKVYDRFSQGNVAKSVINATLLDTTEEWERINLTFSGMDGVMAMYLNIAAGAADIPATRLLGRSPAGENATGESDMRNYYDRLQADQKVRLTPALSRLDEVLLRHVFGSRDEDIYYEWRPLWQLDDVQKAAVALQKAQAHKIDVDNGLLNPEVLRSARENQLIEDGTYPGIEAAIDEFGSEPEEDDHELANRELSLEHSNLDLEMKKAQIAQVKKIPPGGPGGRPNGKPLR